MHGAARLLNTLWTMSPSDFDSRDSTVAFIISQHCIVLQLGSGWLVAFMVQSYSRQPLPLRFSFSRTGAN